MKAMVGSSITSNSYEAGVEVANGSLKGIKNPKISLLFTSVKYNQKELVKGIKSINQNIKIIGCTSQDGIMTQEGIISSDNGFAGMLTLDDNELVVGIAGSSRGNDPRETGINIALKAMKDAGKKFAPMAFAMFATPGEEEYYLKGIQDVIGEVPMFGGSAADDSFTGDWKVLCNDEVYEDGCAVAFFYTTKDMKNVFATTYNETDKVGIITKVENDRHIIEIDNEPALKKYAEWLDCDPDELMGQNVLITSIPRPLGIKTIQGELTLVRHPIMAYPDYSFDISTKISNKTALILLENKVDGLIEGVVDTIKETKQDINPAALLLIHSAGRKLYIGDRLDEDFVAIKTIAGDIPFIVPFTTCEYGQANHSGAHISGLSLSFTSFSK